jgi:hypothetical protein
MKEVQTKSEGQRRKKKRCPKPDAQQGTRCRKNGLHDAP